MSKFHISTQILQGNALFSGKNYTTEKNFIRPPVATVATNFKSELPQTFVFGTDVLLHLVSLLLFVGYFGVPSNEKYLEKKTIIFTSEEQTKGIKGIGW